MGYGFRFAFQCQDTIRHNYLFTTVGHCHQFIDVEKEILLFLILIVRKYLNQFQNVCSLCNIFGQQNVSRLQWTSCIMFGS